MGAALIWPIAGSAHGDYHDRIRELSAALAVKPDDAGLHFALAETCCRHGEWQPALAEAARAEALAPGRFPTDLVRGQALFDARRPAEAVAALDRFLAGEPRHWRAVRLRARAHGADGQAERALADYRAALRLAEWGDPDLVGEAADVLAAHNRTDEALDALAAALARRGSEPALLVRALELELGAGRFDDALGRVAALQMTAPRPEPWMARRAEILSRAGRTAEARDAWQALRDHLAKLPNLERGQPALRALATQSIEAIGPLCLKSPQSPPTSHP